MDEDEEPKNESHLSRNKIPKQVRQWMKRKNKLSQLPLSTSWNNNYERLKEIEEIEEKLENSFEENRMKQENVAIKKIMTNPSFFHSYSRKFSKTKERMSGFVNKGGDIITDPLEQKKCSGSNTSPFIVRQIV